MQFDVTMMWSRRRRDQEISPQFFVLTHSNAMCSHRKTITINEKSVQTVGNRASNSTRERTRNKKKTVYERDFERVCTSMYFGWNLNAPEETEKKNVINQERIMKTERERDRKL